MIKRALAALGAGLTVVLVAACAPSAPSTTSSTSGAGTSAAGTSAAQGSTAAGSGGSTHAGSGKSTMTIATTTDIASYNPLVSVSATDFWINDLMYPTLMSMNAQGKKVPYVATKWGYTSPTEGYFDLRSDMKWSDGTALTASDVAWELNAVLKYKPAGIVTGFVGNLKSAQATSPTHVVLNLTKPDSTIVPEVGFWMRIIPKHVWDKVGDVGKYNPSKDWVSAGPYRLVSANRGQDYTLDRVADYPFAPNNTPTLSSIVFKVYPDVNTELLALKSGAVDVVANPLPPSQVAVLKKTPGISVQDVPGLGYTFLTYNVTHKPLDNVLVRRALAHAVDDVTLRKVVTDGQSISANGVPIAPVLKDWVDPQIKEYAFDPAESRKLLEQAGYKADSSGKFPLSFDLVYSLQDPVIAPMAKLIQSQAAQAGITIVLKGQDRNTFLQSGTDGNFDIYASSFAIEDNPIIGMKLAFLPKGANNYTFVDDPKLNALLNNAATATTMSEQVSLVHQAAQIVHDQVYDNVLFMQNLAVAYRTGWTGWKLEPSQLLSIINPASLANVTFTG